MSQRRDENDVKNLSIAERIILVEEIWDSIVAEQESLGITESQRGELDRRLKSHYDAPDEGVSWQEFKARLQSEK